MNLSNYRLGFWRMVSGAALLLWLSLAIESHAAETVQPSRKGEVQPQPMAAPIESIVIQNSDQKTVEGRPVKSKPIKAGAAVDSAMRAIFGVGMDQNYGLASQHLNLVIADKSKASAEDQAIAKAWLGLLYYNGWGVKTDSIRALVLISEALPQLHRSADAGQSLAQMTLGRLYRNGQGVNEDLPRARDLLQRAANQGSAAANFYLGYMEQKGMGGEVNLKRAQDYYAQSAASGNSFGAYYLSHAYAQGWGGEVDVKSAKIWLDRAVQRKNPEALRAVALDKKAMATTAEVRLTKKESKPEPKPQAKKSESRAKEPVERIIEIAPKKYSNTKLTQASERPAAANKRSAEAVVASSKSRKPISNAARKSFEVATAESLVPATAPATKTKPIAPAAATAPAAAVIAAEPTTAEAPAVVAQAAVGEDIASLIRRSDRGEVDAKLTLAKAYLAGDRVQQDDRRAASLYTQLAEGGNAEAQNALGVLYGTGRGVELNYELATGWYRQAAGQNYPPALFNLAVMVENGWGGETPAGQAGTYFLRSAELGYGQAQWVLVNAYAIGKFSAANSAESAKWLRRAAESGVANAQFQFGAEQLARAVTDAEEDNALAWIRRAALQGLAEARVEIQQRDLAARGSSLEQFRLGTRYYTGDRVPRKAGRALAWWRQSAMNGSGAATVSLARLYASGEMGEADLYKSAACLMIAERLKVDDSQLRAYLLPRLSKSELEQAQAFADNWKIGVALP